MDQERVVVSGRVDAPVAARVDSVLRQEGLTRYWLINAVCEYVAETGRLPALDVTRGPGALDRFRALRARSAKRVAWREGGELD